MAASQTVQIRILDKEYQVQCPPDEKVALLQSADVLDQRMREIRKSGSVIGLERIAIMAALNLSYDLLEIKTTASANSANSEELARIDRKLLTAIQEIDSAG